MRLKTKIWIAYDIYFNWLKPYSFLIFFSIFCVIIIIWISFKKNNIPVNCLYNGVFLIIPCGLLGGSFFGKLEISNKPIYSFYELFYFWMPGMSIHGALIFGLFIGWIWFYFESKNTNISLWIYFDLIVPHILLAQSIGRWGNFFNHEILGLPTTKKKLMWLPPFIYNNLFKWFDNSRETTFSFVAHTKAISIYNTAVNPWDFKNIQYYQPLFLYESLINLILWFLIVFLIPWIFKYSYWFKFKKNNFKIHNLTFFGWWSKLYFDVIPNYIVIKNLSFKPNLKKIYFNNKINKKFNKKIYLYFKYKWLTIQQILKSNCKKIENLENPNKLIILRCGTKTGLKIFLYNLLRLVLKYQRNYFDLFIKNKICINYIIITIFILCGLIIIIFSQFICIYKWRIVDWLYEKQY